MSLSQASPDSHQVMCPEPAERQSRRQTRKSTLADMEQIDSLTLDDFAVDWSRVEIPQKAEGDRLTSEELHRAVDSFLATIREH